MSKRIVLLTVIMAALVLPVAAGAEEKAPTVADHMAALQSMCDESATARAERHAAKPLYERLGSYDKILELTTEIVRLHSVNDPIKHTLDGVDHKLLAKHVADFMAAGIGGTAKYTGRTLPASHAHLKLTDAHFLAAGGDVMTAMKSMDYGQNEIDEVVCILVSLKDQVVFK